jgi:hypothetical protein
VSLRIPFPFPLRPDFTAVLILPDDLTEREAERICANVRAIAMPPDEREVAAAMREFLQAKS